MVLVSIHVQLYFQVQLIIPIQHCADVVLAAADPFANDHMDDVIYMYWII